MQDAVEGRVGGCETVSCACGVVVREWVESERGYCGCGGCVGECVEEVSVSVWNGRDDALNGCASYHLPQSSCWEKSHVVDYERCVWECGCAKASRNIAHVYITHVVTVP